MKSSIKHTLLPNKWNLCQILAYILVVVHEWTPNCRYWSSEFPVTARNAGSPWGPVPSPTEQLDLWLVRRVKLNIKVSSEGNRNCSVVSLEFYIWGGSYCLFPNFAKYFATIRLACWGTWWRGQSFCCHL